MENEINYVIAAYIIAIIPLTWLFLSSRKKYKKLKREVARAKLK